MLHAELSPAEHATEYSPSSARATQEARCKSAIASVCLGDPKMAVVSLHLFAAMICLIILSLCVNPSAAFGRKSKTVEVRRGKGCGRLNHAHVKQVTFPRKFIQIKAFLCNVHEMHDGAN